MRRSRQSFSHATLALAVLAALSAPHRGARAQESASQTVEVIGTSPLPGQGIDRDRLPYSTQVIRRAELDKAQPDHLTDYMARRIPGMQVNDIQGSPYQADLTYRGFRASGLLGASQGLSVYLDGVRINEPFGDVVNWDMLPEFALDSVSLVPGANPAFGLNTLGGALSFTTASGITAPGLRAEIGAGSFGRKNVQASYGHAGDDGWHQYVGASLFDEDGWRDHSPGRVAQAIVKIGRSEGDSSWSVGLLGGRSTLIGNGLVPAYTFDEDGGDLAREPDLYAASRSAIYTYPDETKNRLAQLTLNWRQQIDAESELALLAYVRSARRSTVNGDTADDDDDGDDDEATLAPRRARALAEDDEPNAVFNTTQTRQSAWGLAANFTRRSGVHQWQLGASVDASRVRFSQFEQPGFLDDTRGVVAGSDPAEQSVAVKGDAQFYGLHASDTWQLSQRTFVTGTARFNHARVSNTLSTLDEDAGALEAQPRETFRYNSFNPGLGISHRVVDALTLFANAARNNRVPTVIELGCADPETPCRLPAGLQSDPYLKQVKSTSLELGLRWRTMPGSELSFTAYRTTNRDDILFTSVSTTSQLGYFQNFPRTRNQGADLQWRGQLGTLSLQAAYSWLRATYEADGLLRIGERNVQVRPGMRMAGLPKQTLKLGADWQALPVLSMGADLQVMSRRITQGNEDGLVEDGEDDRADLGLAGYAVFNLRAAWKITRSVELTARVNNVFDRRYETYGALAGTVFSPQGEFTGVERDGVFVAPGTPRSFFAGLRVTFD